MGIFAVSDLSPGKPFDWDAFTRRVECFPGQLMVIFVSYGECHLTTRWRWYAPVFEGEFVIRVAFINKVLTPPHLFREVSNGESSTFQLSNADLSADGVSAGIPALRERVSRD